MINSTKSFNAPPISPMNLGELPPEIARNAYCSRYSYSFDKMNDINVLCSDGTSTVPFFSLDNPMYDIFMEYCDDKDLRKMAYSCRSTRASFQNPDLNNSLVIEDIRAARYQKATGF